MTETKRLPSIRVGTEIILPNLNGSLAFRMNFFPGQLVTGWKHDARHLFIYFFAFTLRVAPLTFEFERRCFRRFPGAFYQEETCHFANWVAKVRIMEPWV